MSYERRDQNATTYLKILRQGAINTRGMLVFLSRMNGVKFRTKCDLDHNPSTNSNSVQLNVR